MAPSILTLKQAQELLTDTASTFAELVKEALELWLQVAEELPRKSQHPQTAAATDLVQAALQQAPWRMQHHDSSQVAWLKKHLPGFNTAMQISVSGKLGILARRVNILQQVASTQQQAASAQFLACMVSEYSTYLRLDALSHLLFLVLPLEALCGECMSTQQSRSKQQQRLQQGNNLISMVGCSLTESAGVRAEVNKQKAQICTQLKPYTDQIYAGMRELGNSGHTVYTHRTSAQELVGKASLLWLSLASRLPPRHKATMLFLQHVDWLQLSHLRTAHHKFDDLLKRLVIEVASKTEFLMYQRPFLVRRLLHYIGWTAVHVHATSLSVAEQQQVLTILQDQDTDADADAVQGYNLFLPVVHVAASGSATSSVQAAGTDTVGSATAGKAEAAGPEDDLIDMQVLLRMMYGCTVNKDGMVGGMKA